MADSFLCDNCGIKVPGAEGSACPGCGHISDNSVNSGSQANSAEENNSFDQTPKNNEAIFASKYLMGRKSDQHVVDCEALFDKSKPYIDQPEVAQEVINRTKEVIRNELDKESQCRLNAYISQMYRITYRYEESFERGVLGIKSSEIIIKHQCYDSILDSLFNLNRFQEFETWAERALKDKFVDAEYYRIKYLTKMEKFDEALSLCDSHFSANMDFANANRADILVRAKRFDEAEQLFRKLISNGPRNQYVSSWINTLAFSVLIPQRRFVEAESILISSLCTNVYREKINSYSNLATVAFNLKEYDAAKRYARIASIYDENAIASESRLTLCKIEFQRLQESENSSLSEWKSLFAQVKDSFLISDVDDVPDFLSLLMRSGEKSEEADQILEIIESEYTRLSKIPVWNFNAEVRINFQGIRVDLLSRRYLSQSKFLELDDLLINSITELKDQRIEVLLDYLRTPFAAIDLRRAALECRDVGFLAEWASFEEQSEIIYSLAKYQEEPILVALAENPASPDAVCELIASKSDLDLDFALCGRAKLSARLVQVLSNSSFEATRKLIAIREDLEEETYRLLATDKALLVRDAIRENQNCSAEIRALAALGSL